jgi:hypothetical protein
MAPRLSIQPLTEAIAEKNVQGHRDERLAKQGAVTVRVLLSAIFSSGSGIKQTGEARRRRFMQAVIPVLEINGWRHAGRCVLAKAG